MTDDQETDDDRTVECDTHGIASTRTLAQLTDDLTEIAY